MPSINPIGKTYKPTQFMRHPLTRRNQEELGIPAKVDDILSWETRTWRGAFQVLEYVKARAKKESLQEKDRWVNPTGFSLNKVRYGDYPKKDDTAHQRGWYAYMNVGVPLIEERRDILQPPPDVICEQTYVNRTDPAPVQWTNTVEFSISNTISWSLEGEIQLTFGARSTAQLQNSIQHSLAQKGSSTNITTITRRTLVPRNRNRPSRPPRTRRPPPPVGPESCTLS
jgi:hypothetical protein